MRPEARNPPEELRRRRAGAASRAAAGARGRAGRCSTRRRLRSRRRQWPPSRSLPRPQVRSAPRPRARSRDAEPHRKLLAPRRRSAATFRPSTSARVRAVRRRGRPGSSSTRRRRAPLTIGIKAPWGAGKTSLMRMIRKQLQDPDAPRGPRRLADGPRLTIWQVLTEHVAGTTPAEAANELEPDPHEQGDRAPEHDLVQRSGSTRAASSCGRASRMRSSLQASDRLPPLARDRLWASVAGAARSALPALRGAPPPSLHGPMRLAAVALAWSCRSPIALGVLVAWRVDHSLLGTRGLVAGAVVDRRHRHCRGHCSVRYGRGDVKSDPPPRRGARLREPPRLPASRRLRHAQDPRHRGRDASATVRRLRRRPRSLLVRGLSPR